MQELAAVSQTPYYAGDEQETRREPKPDGSCMASLTRIAIDQTACRRCYRCVRVCPTNALKIDRERVQEIPQRCILCGRCFKLCPHQAVDYGASSELWELLGGDAPVVACLDATHPAVLDRGTPGQMVTALKKLGFAEVWEAAFGGDLMAQAYSHWLADYPDDPWISSFCPAVVFYIEKFAPRLLPRLVPIVSPMGAVGRAIRHVHGPNVRVIFISSCLAAMGECADAANGGDVDGALTFFDVIARLNERGIAREEQPACEFDGPRPGSAGLLAVAGGLSECIGFEQSILNHEFVVRSRPSRVKRVLQQQEENQIQARFFDLLFCDGCVHGPIIDSTIPGPSRREMLVNHVRTRIQDADVSDLARFAHLDLSRGFTDRPATLPSPSEEEIQAALVKLGRTYPDQNLDCDGCGHRTCRHEAIAIAQGIAEYEMCPHYLLNRSRAFYTRLEKAHGELKRSQAQLIQTEKLASLGQMAAGVAHELNNPLGAITMLAAMLKRELTGDEKRTHDLGMIVQEAERAAKIVSDLLSFSRKAKVRPGLTDIGQVIHGSLDLLEKQALFRNVSVTKDLSPALPQTFADPDLLRQVILNIVLNGAQAMEGTGTLTIAARGVAEDRAIEIRITDTGGGIPPEQLSRIFDPFFTTKEKGTGLGLAIVYGIVSRHQGRIWAESKVGKGTVFVVYMPVLDSREWLRGEDEGLAPTGGEGGR